MSGNKLPKVLRVVNHVTNKGGTIVFKIQIFEREDWCQKFVYVDDKIGDKNLVMTQCHNQVKALLSSLHSWGLRACVLSKTTTH